MGEISQTSVQTLSFHSVCGVSFVRRWHWHFKLTLDPSYGHFKYNMKSNGQSCQVRTFGMEDWCYATCSALKEWIGQLEEQPQSEAGKLATVLGPFYTALQLASQIIEQWSVCVKSFLRLLLSMSQINCFETKFEEVLQVVSDCFTDLTFALQFQI